MKKNASKETKADLKNLPSKKTVKTKIEARGGARSGAGRKPKNFDTQQIHIDMPTELINALNEAAIINKTAYIVKLVANDLKMQPLAAKTKKQIDKIINAII